MKKILTMMLLLFSLVTIASPCNNKDKDKQKQFELLKKWEI